MKKQRYIGRIEFIAQKEYIIEKLRSGYTSQMIYDELLTMKNITISYRQFCRCIQQYSGIQSTRKKRIVKQKNTSKKMHTQNITVEMYYMRIKLLPVLRKILRLKKEKQRC